MERIVTELGLSLLKKACDGDAKQVREKQLRGTQRVIMSRYSFELL